MTLWFKKTDGPYNVHSGWRVEGGAEGGGVMTQFVMTHKEYPGAQTSAMVDQS